MITATKRNKLKLIRRTYLTLFFITLLRKVDLWRGITRCLSYICVFGEEKIHFEAAAYFCFLVRPHSQLDIHIRLLSNRSALPVSWPGITVRGSFPFSSLFSLS